MASSISWNNLEELDDDITELPSPTSKSSEKTIRRRSSKACDQCRKSKCKCERSSENEPCRSCVLLGTQCTFLGPSRKRGPPKGYIDAIESRLHQLEALLGIVISSTDPRAQSLVADLAQDALAREIIGRVDNSPFGSKGRKKSIGSSREAFLAETGDGGSSRHASSKRQQLASRGLAIPAEGNPPFVTPSNEWQDHLASRVLANGLARQHGQLPSAGPYMYDQATHSGAVPVLPPLDMSTFAFSEDVKPSPTSAISPTSSLPISLATPLQIHPSGRYNSTSVSPRRTRRRMELPDSAPIPRDWSSSPPGRSDLGSGGETSNSDEVVDAVGQLSLDEHEQVRYHGKASGLHLLGKNDRRDKRIEGGVWRFPPARVWPPVANRVVQTEEELAVRARLPSRAQQEHLLELYFTYVHPVLPIVLKNQFMEDFRERSESPASYASAESNSPTSFPSQPGKLSSKVPTLLLLSMFAIAARYSNSDTPLPPEGNMWTAGDAYLEDAKTILNQIYASSRPSTCQALLLMSYREIGIGAMAQAWLYVGMAVRMAQDLGMHRSVDKWQLGSAKLFTHAEKQLRKRIWYTCVIMDKYVSTYIGRPLSIFDRDFDTTLPDEEEVEEMEPWEAHPTIPEGLNDNSAYSKAAYVPVPSRPVGCFNASATLSSLISVIVQALYSVRGPHSSKQAEAAQLEQNLDKWYLDLPEYFRYEPAIRKLPVPPPHVLTLVMKYWTTVLLLHRPFIQFKPHHDNASDDSSDAFSLKAYDMCVNAANHISTIVAAYMDNFCLKRSPAFLSYYIFSAGIMHVVTLSMKPSDVQAALHLQKCMDALKRMEILWPSAGRAWELLHGSNVEVRESEIARLANPPESRRKRSAVDAVDMEDIHAGSNALAETSNSRSTMSHPYGVNVPSSESLPYFGQYTRWNHDSLGFGAPMHSGNSEAHSYPQPSPVEPNVLPQIGSFMGSTQPSSGRYPNYWGEYHETFGDPAALTTSLYNHPLLAAGMNGHPSAPPNSGSMYVPPEYSGFGNMPHSQS